MQGLNAFKDNTILALMLYIRYGIVNILLILTQEHADLPINGGKKIKQCFNLGITWKLRRFKFDQ